MGKFFLVVVVHVLYDASFCGSVFGCFVGHFGEFGILIEVV